MDFEFIRSEKIYKGRIINLVVDHVRYESGNEGVREVVEHPGGGAVLALFDNDDILLVRQHRYPINDFVLELPAGKLDAGEDPQKCAERELREETGYVASRWRKLTTIMTTPGFCNERLHIYMAQGLSQSPQGQSLEEGERTIKVLRVPLVESLAMIERGEIVDGKTIAGIFLGERILRKSR